MSCLAIHTLEPGIICLGQHKGCYEIFEIESVTLSSDDPRQNMYFGKFDKGNFLLIDCVTIFL